MRAVALALLGALALASVAQGFRYAVQYSTDFQWSPTVLASDGVNPYQVALAGNPEGRILLSQFPPYLHWLYIVFLPLAYLPYGLAKLLWAIANFGFACASLVILRRLFRLATPEALALAALFFISTPYRNAVGNGQTSLMCLFTLLIAWIFQNESPAGAGASLSVLLTKYSFAPPILLWFVLRGKLELLLTSLFLLTAGWLMFSWICHENPLATLGQPLQVASLYSEAEGGGDVMTLVRSFGWDRPVAGAVPLGGLVGLLTTGLWIGLLRLQASRLSEPEILVGLCLVSLLAIRHLAYDFVFVGPMAALAFVLPRPWRWAAFALIGYLWFGVKGLDVFHINGKWVELTSFVALNLMLLIVIAAGRANSPRGP